MKQDFETFYKTTYSNRRTILKDQENRIFIKSSGSKYCRRLFIHCPYNPDFNVGVKKLKGRHWDNPNKCWSVPVSQKEDILALCDHIYGTDFIAQWNKQKCLTTNKTDLTIEPEVACDTEFYEL